MDNKSLFVDLFDLDLLNKIKSEPKLKTYLQDIEKVRLSYLNKDIPEIPFHLFKLYYITGNRMQYERAYFERRKRLMTFGLSLWLEETEENLACLEDILWAVCHEYTWALPAHSAIDDPRNIDLFASETAFALAEIIHLHGDKLNPIVRKRCIEEVRKRVIYTYLNQETTYHWELEKNNWCAVCAGSIGIATLYLESEEIIEKMLVKITPRLADFIGSFEEDGTCLEGIGYWTYGVSFYVAFADLLSQTKGCHVDLLKEDKFKQIALFQQKCHLKGNQTISFSDGNQRDDYRLGLTTYLSYHIHGVSLPDTENVAGFHSDTCYRWCHGIRDLIWTVKYQEKSKLKKSKKALVEHSSLDHSTYVLADAQWLICNGDKGFAIKGGHNFEPHNHNDIGHFVYYKNGRNILADLGAGEYVKDYFNENRYSIFCNRSMSHSVPIIQGHEQLEGINRRAIVNELHESTMNIDIESAYDLTYLQKLNRQVIFDYVTGIMLEDTYILDRDETKVTERFISYCKPNVCDGYVEIGQEDSVSTIRLLSHNYGIHTQILEYEHLDHDGHCVIIYAIDFNFVLKSGQSKIVFRIQ